jgi:hypothetical protein
MVMSSISLVNQVAFPISCEKLTKWKTGFRGLYKLRIINCPLSIGYIGGIGILLQSEG